MQSICKRPSKWTKMWWIKSVEYLSDKVESYRITGPTVKRILPELIRKNLIEKHGKGPGTNYPTV